MHSGKDTANLFLIIRDDKEKCATIFLCDERRLVIKIGPTPASFQTHITIFTTNKSEKMSIQYTVPRFKLMTYGT